MLLAVLYIFTWFCDGLNICDVSNICPSSTIVGCYQDRTIKDMSDLLFTDRDEKSIYYSGIRIDWYNYEDYLTKLVALFLGYSLQHTRVNG